MTENHLHIQDSQGAIGQITGSTVTQNFITGPSPEKKVEVPYLLPYMSDRSTPKRQFIEECHYHRNHKAGRPLVLLIHGRENESHLNFLKTLFEEPIRTRFGTNPVLDPIRLAWYVKGNLEARLDAMVQDLGDKLVDDAGATPQSLAAAMSGSGGHSLFEQFIYSKNTLGAHQDVGLLKRWFQWWAALPQVTPGKEPILFLTIVYPAQRREPPKKSLFSFFRKAEVVPDEMPFRLFLGEGADSSQPRPPAYRINPGQRLHAVALCELKAVPLPDVRNWVKDLNLEHCPSQALLDELDEIYQQREAMPMKELSVLLAQTIKKIMKEQTA